MSKYLLETGVEELPYKFISSAELQLKESFKKFLENNKLSYSDISVLTTPRRLCVIIDGISDFQQSSLKVFKGPSIDIAYDEKGNLTKAGLGFVKKNGLSLSDLYTENGYLTAKVEVQGISAKEILAKNVPNIILKLQGSHFMRWSSHDEKFSRPIRWLVSLYNDEELKVRILDIVSSRFSRGHRSYPRPVEINNPDEYIEKLKKAYVIVNQTERQAKILELANIAAAKAGFEAKISNDLLKEITNICEWPAAVLCDFDEKYLSIPDEVTITVMETHQRYIPLFKNEKLTNNFITIANYTGSDYENIKAGNLRVIKARLDDAVFFFKNDTKKNLEEYVENLKGITFQKGMGTVYEKVQRLINLSKHITEELDINSDTVIRTAYLCKADLATSLVFEFTELQGYIGADYARISGEDNRVVNGIKEHYFPLNSDSALAEGIEGQITGIADKIDTICAVFASGNEPTGSSDPLGIRRAALGIIKTIIEKKLDINLSRLIKIALEQLPVQADCMKCTEEFVIRRLIIYLSDKYRKDILESCLILNPLESLCDYLKRVNALSEFSSPITVENANRIIRIIKGYSFDKIDKNLFQGPEEQELYDMAKSIVNTDNYSEYLKQLEGLNSKINVFFEKVLVMDKEESIKNNRIALLVFIKNLYESVADFSKIKQ